MDPLISTRRPELVIINKKKKKEKLPNCIVDFVVTSDHRVKLKESEKRGKYLEFTRKKLPIMEPEGNWDINCNLWDDSQRIGTRTGRRKNKRKSGEHSDYSIIKISQNTEKSPGD